MRISGAAAIALAVAVAQMAPAMAKPGPPHQERFGRLSWRFPRLAGFTTEQAGDIVTLRFSGAGAVPPVSATRNIVAIARGPGTVSVTMAPGARLRTLRLGNRVVLDVFDPAPPAQLAPSAVTPVAIPVAAVAPIIPVTVSQLPPPVTEPAGALSPPATLALAASPVAGPPGQPGAVLLPFAPGVGGAAFRRNGAAWLVFDQARPVDLDAVASIPAFKGATVQLLPQATVVRVPIAVAAQVRMERRPAGWAVTIAPSGPAAAPVTPEVQDGHLLLPAASPGGVVAVPDPETGGNLLVGTVRAQAAGVAVAYQMPGFTLLASWQGVAVEALSDRTVLRDGTDGFVVDTGSPLSAAPAGSRALADAAFLTRRFDFPALPPATLLRQLQAGVAQAGAAPAQSRLAPRRAAAQTMIALGMGPEAEALLHLAVTEDPRAEGDPDTVGLTAIAALLAGRPSEAAGLSDPALTGTDEVTLWRAVRAALVTEGAPDAASLFATTAKLALAYPAPLRDRLLPLVVETMAAGGQGAAADLILGQRPDDPGLGYARALRQEAKGDGGAVAAYDALAAGRDQSVSARAATRATLLRLSSGALSAGDAADRLERSFLDWRGDGRELDLRLRAAALRAQAGQWRAAMTILREAEALYPDDLPMIHERMAALLGDLLTGPGASSIAPLDLVALADENAEALARVAPGPAATLLADKLAALDLPSRAAPILDRMILAAPAGPAQAALGETLASLRLADNDAGAARAVLAATVSADLPAELAERRGLLAGRAAASLGDTAGAAAILAAVGTAAADDARATVLANAKDWHGAQAALADLAAKTVPAAGVLTPTQQDTILRLASVQSRNGDAAALRDSATLAAGRMDGPRADMLHLLTAAPVGGTDDLGRAKTEVPLARAIPAAIAAIGIR